MWGPATRSRPLDRPLAFVGIIALLVTLIEMPALTNDAADAWVFVLFPLTGTVYVSAGLLAWHRRPGSQMGPLLVAGGVLWFIISLANTDIPVLIAAGQVVATTGLAFVVHLLLAFPSGRISSPAARVVVGAGYMVCLVLQAPIYLFGRDDPPYDVLQVTARPDLVASARTVQSLAGILVMAATMALLIYRWRSAEPRHRRVLGPLYAFGVLVVVAEPLTARLIGAPGVNPLMVVVVQLVLLALVPAVFAWCALRGGFARTQKVEELATWLAESGPRPHIEEGLAGALGDPTLKVMYAPAPARDHPPDRAAGRLPRSSFRDVVEVTVRGRPVAWISYDASLISDRDQVAAAGRVVAIELDRERLNTELVDRSRELADSRSRIAQAEDTTRRRIARDLHDGLQVQLVRLAVDIGRLAQCADATGPIESEASRLRAALDNTAGDLRRLVQGLMPGLLIERGLYAATDELLDSAPFRVDLSIAGTDRGLPPSVESAAYFVVAEALSNAIKHSGAQNLCVAIERSGASLRLEVQDDGLGGAGLDGGCTGLRGLADRLDVLGGALHLVSPPQGGDPRDSGDPVRVVIAEDQALLREGLALVLSDAGYEVAAAASDAPGLLGAVETLKPELVVTDPDATHLARRGPARGVADPSRPSKHRRAGPVPVRAPALRSRARAVHVGRHRIPTQATDLRHQHLSDAAEDDLRGRHGARRRGRRTTVEPSRRPHGRPAHPPPAGGPGTDGRRAQ